MDAYINPRERGGQAVRTPAPEPVLPVVQPVTEPEPEPETEAAEATDKDGESDV